MTITEKLFSILSGSATLTALVPAARIKPPGAWQNLVRPYIVQVPIAIEPTNTNEGLKALRVWTYQISVFADTFSNGEAVAVAVKELLGNYRQDGVISYWRAGVWYLGLDPDVGNIHHFAPQFLVAETLAA